MFHVGQPYERSTLHERYGGQEQGGISTPARHPVILCFTGSQGEQYGYQDDWTPDGVFMYTGEGQRGDMQFVRGNRAVLDHASEGKDLHLFEYTSRGTVRYLGQMVCAGYERRHAPDVEGKERSAIVFELLPIDAFREDLSPSDVDDQELSYATLEGLRKLALEQSNEPMTPKESKRAAFARSKAVREYILLRADGTCEACGQLAPFRTPCGRLYLEPHHLRRLSDGGPDHPSHVAAVCPNCHRRAHYSSDHEHFNARIAGIVANKENAFDSGA